MSSESFDRIGTKAVRSWQSQFHHKPGIEGSQGRRIGDESWTRLVALDRCLTGRPSLHGRASLRGDLFSVEEINEIELVIRPEKEVGDGPQCVYLYFNPNDRRLAELEGRDVWECKIGRTSSRDAIQRILGQGIRTSLSHAFQRSEWLFGRTILRFSKTRCTDRFG